MYRNKLAVQADGRAWPCPWSLVNFALAGVSVDPALPGLRQDHRGRRQHQEHRLRYDEQRDGPVGRGFPLLPPRGQGRGRGQGFFDRSAGPDRRDQQLRPHEPPDEEQGDRRVREAVRLQACPAAHQHRHAGRLRPQGQPDQGPDPAAGRRHLQRDPQGRLHQGHHDLGRPGADRRVERQAHQHVRPQQRLGHLRLLQGPRAVQGRLQERGQGAARQQFRGAGHRLGQVRHRLQRHRLHDQRRARGAPELAGGDRRGLHGRRARQRLQRATIPWPASSTCRSTTSPAASWTICAPSSCASSSARRARKSWSRTATCPCRPPWPARSWKSVGIEPGF